MTSKCAVRPSQAVVSLVPLLATRCSTVVSGQEDSAASGHAVHADAINDCGQAVRAPTVVRACKNGKRKCIGTGRLFGLSINLVVGADWLHVFILGFSSLMFSLLIPYARSVTSPCRLRANEIPCGGRAIGRSSVSLTVAAE